MEKFERLNEASPARDEHDNLIIMVILFVGIIMASAWYYQNYIYSDPNYENKNEIKQLESKENFLKSEIERIINENSELNKNQAKIYNY